MRMLSIELAKPQLWARVIPIHIQHTVSTNNNNNNNKHESFAKSTKKKRTKKHER